MADELKRGDRVAMRDGAPVVGPVGRVGVVVNVHDAWGTGARVDVDWDGGSASVNVPAEALAREPGAAVAPASDPARDWRVFVVNERGTYWSLRWGEFVGLYPENPKMVARVLRELSANGRAVVGGGEMPAFIVTRLGA